MIQEVTMYAANCDKCNTPWESYHGYSAMFDKSQVVDCMSDQEWIIGDHLEGDEHKDKVYCPDCATVDDDDKIVFKEPKKVQPAQVSDTTMFP